MVLEYTFDDLMEQVGRKEFVDIRPGKTVGEWLKCDKSVSIGAK